jgi:hypothetical protein
MNLKFRPCLTEEHQLGCLMGSDIPSFSVNDCCRLLAVKWSEYASFGCARYEVIMSPLAGVNSASGNVYIMTLLHEPPNCYITVTSRPMFWKTFNSFCLGACGILRKVTISFVMSVRLSADSSAPTGRIFVELHIWGFFENMSKTFKVSLKPDKNNGYSTWRRIYIEDNNLPNSS